MSTDTGPLPGSGSAAGRPTGFPAEPATTQLAAELRVSLMRAVRRLRAEKSDEGVTDAQFSVLALLDREGPMSPRVLAARERVQPPTMTRTLGSLLDAVLVERTGSLDDRRQAIITLTNRGRETVQATRLRRNVWLAGQLTQLSLKERDVLASASTILRRIADS